MNCSICKEKITDKVFDVILVQEKYPDIDIGPYCPVCIREIRICSYCQHPHNVHTSTIVKGGNCFCPECVIKK